MGDSPSTNARREAGVFNAASRQQRTVLDKAKKLLKFPYCVSDIHFNALEGSRTWPGEPDEGEGQQAQLH